MIVVTNPARPDERVGTVDEHDADHVAAVVEQAAAAQRGWEETPVGQRCALLAAAAAATHDTVTQRLAHTLCLEMGKPLADCAGEMGFATAYARDVAERTPALVGPVEVDDAAGRTTIRREPFGVVAAITPWNAPIILTMLKVAPALATGNAVVVKPSPLAPLAVTEWFATLAEHLPAGLLAIINGGADTGAALVGHPAVAKVAFTGGTEGGRAVLRLAADRIIPSLMELGGNDAAIVCEDAELTDATIERLVLASFLTSGQVCMAAKRVLVHASRIDEVLERYEAAAQRVLVVGDPRHPATTIGPVISAEARDAALGLIGRAAGAGGTVTPVGTIADRSAFERGHYVHPTVVTGLADDEALWCEEQFAPVVPISAFGDEDEAVERANATPHGLASSVWSADEDRAFALAARLRAGTTFINTHNRTGMSLRTPFGGRGASGFGREYGDEGVLAHTQTHAIHAPAAFRPGADDPTGVGGAYPGADR